MCVCVRIHCVAQHAHFNQEWVRHQWYGVRYARVGHVCVLLLFVFSVTMHTGKVYLYRISERSVCVCACVCARVCAWDLISQPLVDWLRASASRTPDPVSNGFLLCSHPKSMCTHTHASINNLFVPPSFPPILSVKIYTVRDRMSFPKQDTYSFRWMLLEFKPCRSVPRTTCLDLWPGAQYILHLSPFDSTNHWEICTLDLLVMAICSMEVCMKTHQR